MSGNRAHISQRAASDFFETRQWGSSLAVIGLGFGKGNNGALVHSLQAIGRKRGDGSSGIFQIQRDHQIDIVRGTRVTVGTDRMTAHKILSHLMLQV